MTIPLSDLPRYARRNWLAYFADYALFGLGITFASPATVLPTFAAQLTTNKVLIGAVSAVWSGAWLLPQLLAANYVGGQARKWPILMRSAWIGRPMFLAFALFLVLGGARYPGLTLLLLILGIGFFAGMDALSAIAWFDMLGKTLGPRARARMMGAGQVTNGLLSFGAGALIAYLLGERGQAYPINYAVIFAAAGALFMVSMLACYFIVEPREEGTHTESVPLGQLLTHMVALLRADPAFLRMNAARLLIGGAGMALPFYAIYALQELGFPLARVGVFVTVQTLGITLAGLAMGVLADRRGSHRVVQAIGLASLAAPLLALALSGLGAGQAALQEWLFPLVFGLTGLADGAVSLGYFNYILDIAPPAKRPAYMGLANTLSGLLLIMPLIGGWVVQTASYRTAFALSAALVVPGVALAFTLTRPRSHSN